jgi:hypothetical protein
MEAVIGIIGIVVAIATYYAGMRHGKQLEKERQKHEIELEKERRVHEIAIEQDRRIHELSLKLTDEYVDMVRRSIDGGTHALAKLGLDKLGTDSEIRNAIDQMQARTGKDPWGRDKQLIESVDLVMFFKYVRDNNINFFKTTISDIVAKMEIKQKL